MSKNTISPTALNSSEISPPPQDVLTDNGSNGHRNLHVDGEAAELFIAEKRIGERIKHLRLRKSMGLVDLGRHTGWEFLYRVWGTLDVRHGEATHPLEPGDAVYFDATPIHSYVCTGKRTATAVIVTLQHPLLQQLGNGSRAINLGNGKVRGVPA